jgi:hypothetical protein
MSSGIHAAVSAFLEKAEWSGTPVADHPTWLRLHHAGATGQWQCLLQVREDQSQFFFFSMAALYVPEARRPAVAEFLTRANFGLIIGNFEMDYDDGEVRYKTYFDAQGFELSAETVETHILANLAVFDRYNPGLMAVAFGDKDPAEVVKAIEAA